MLIFDLIILLLFMAGALLSLNNSQNIWKDIDKKEHKLYVLYPIADFILTKTGLDKKLNQKRNINDAVKALNVTTKPELLQKLFWYKRVSLVVLIIIIFDIFSILGQITAGDGSIIKDGRYLKRPEHGEGSREVLLNVTIEQEDGKKQDEENNKTKKNKPKPQNITINVKERPYTKEEVNELFSRAYQYLETAVLGKNQSAKLIYENLNFTEAVPGTGVTVEWQPEDNNLIQSDGTVNNKNICAEGINTTVNVKLIYKEQQAVYTMSFMLMPRLYEKEEQLQEILQKEIDTYAVRTAKEDYQELPEKVEEYKLSWNDKEKSGNNSSILIFGIIAAIVVWIFMEKELEDKMKKRREQMLFDYPEIINKFTLLVNAGMTVKQAWNRISEDYNNKLSQKKKQKHYAYEEILLTANELKLGLPEAIAYEQFGRRVGVISYIKFASLITQNLKKGNKGFTDLLMREAIESFEDRKEIAKRLGEEAGTKLLIPMVFMLIIVLLIIMIPAFSSFAI